MNDPLFVGIGAMKSGTTWWHNLICHHPAVTPAVVPGWEHTPMEPLGWVGKQLHFFDTLSQAGPAEAARYRAHFPGPASGEWSPSYLHSWWIPPLLHAIAPDTRIIAILRDPADRYVSNMRHNQKHPIREGGTPIDDRWPWWRHEAFMMGLYGQHLNRWAELFPNLLVLQYEQCVADTDGQLDRTFEFLELDPVPAGELGVDTNTNTNPGITDDVVTGPEIVELRAAYRHSALICASRYRLDRTLWPSTSKPRVDPGEPA